MEVLITGENLIDSKILWNEPLLPELDEFAEQHNLYSHCIVTIYQIVRDLHIKQEVVELQILDGLPWQRGEYFIEGRARVNGKMRLMVPFYLDAEIDLPWFVKNPTSHIHSMSLTRTLMMMPSF